VLLCLNEKCRCAVSPAAISDYLRKQYQVQLELRKQVNQYIKKFSHYYDYSTINLPVNRLALQLVIKVVNSLKCKNCPIQPFRTQSRKALKQHGNKVYNKKRVANKNLFCFVKLQSWF
jgi:hypothetical protein